MKLILVTVAVAVGFALVIGALMFLSNARR